ncbi:CHASE domain-containing protein [Marivibrio halodurans]|uniref:histidine kinase n=1 Tax=Marivibrio halodurans TaxID=2039722 RepID=A0A8J7S2C9_9PROT|nr:ATP-binding protein [Marivibrio halodurans]MBP5859082.1 CHASE domain-containing protein [Marivibrio halodurans]
MHARAQRLICFIAAAVLAVLGGALVLEVEDTLEDRRLDDFRVESERVTLAIDAAMTRLNDRLKAIGAYLVTSEAVTESEFALFIASTDLFAENDIRVASILPVIRPVHVPVLNRELQERDGFRKELGYPEVRIRKPVTRDVVMPVLYTETPDGRRRAVGLDIASNRNRREAAEQAIATGKTQLSAPLRFFNSPEEGVPGMILIRAVSSGNLGLPMEVAGDDRMVLVAFGFTPQTMIGNLLRRSDLGRIGVEIHDVTAGEPQPVANIPVQGAPGAFSREQRLEVAGRTWSITYEAGPVYMATVGNWWLYLIAGVAFVLLIALTFAIDKLIRRREILASAVEERTVQLRLMNEQLAAAATRAHAASDAKSEFLAHMSHELRTPLNALIGFSDMLSSEIHGPLGHRKYVEYAHDMQLAGSHLLALISDILDLARVEAGATEIDEDGIVVGDLLRDCARITAAQAQARLVAVSVDCGPTLPPLLADERLIRQVVLNLVSNAIKYNRPQGRVTIAADKDESGGIRIRVIDTGIGIDPEDMEHVLEPFGQARFSETAAVGGTGLGLALARRFVELHGGTLTLESTPRLGTTVTVRFPKARSGRTPLAHAM